MKKLLTALLAIIMAITTFTFVGCDNSDAIFKGNYKTASEETKVDLLSNASDSSQKEIQKN